MMNPSSKLRYVSCLLDCGESSDVEEHETVGPYLLLKVDFYS
jgi:hypothetical protein